MANIDVGTYFFTAAVPVCNEGIVKHRSRSGRGPEIASSPIHVVREVLDTLPTALQSHATEKIGLNSPFSRNLRTHFTRFIILDQPNFNGRDHSDALVNAVMKTDLLDPQPVDQLTCPYILWAIDFDLGHNGDKQEPRRYLEELWGQMEGELRSIFQYCYGFDTVKDASSFADYMIRCQIETTMPFHDYWYLPPKLPSASILGLAWVSILGLLILVCSLAASVLRWTQWAWAAQFATWSGWSWMPWLGLALLVIGLPLAYWRVIYLGRKPFPASPGADLPNVLKALYLQQAFTRFASEQQRRDSQEWGPAFREFLNNTKPGDLSGPTQAAGVIRSDLEKVV